MPKHIHKDQYLKNPSQLVPPVTIYPDIQDRGDNFGGLPGHHMLPGVFEWKAGEQLLTFKYPGPGVFFVSEGEVEYQDIKNFGPKVRVSAGGVVHPEQGEVLHWSSPSGGKGFAVFWVPESVKNFEAFLVPG